MVISHNLPCPSPPPSPPSYSSYAQYGANPAAHRCISNSSLCSNSSRIFCIAFRATVLASATVRPRLVNGVPTCQGISITAYCCRVPMALLLMLDAMQIRYEGCVWEMCGEAVLQDWGNSATGLGELYGTGLDACSALVQCSGEKKGRYPSKMGIPLAAGHHGPYRFACVCESYCTHCRRLEHHPVAPRRLLLSGPWPHHRSRNLMLWPNSPRSMRRSGAVRVVRSW